MYVRRCKYSNDFFMPQNLFESFFDVKLQKVGDMSKKLSVNSWFFGVLGVEIFFAFLRKIVEKITTFYPTLFPKNQYQITAETNNDIRHPIAKCILCKGTYKKNHLQGIRLIRGASRNQSRGFHSRGWSACIAGKDSRSFWGRQWWKCCLFS